MFSRRFVESKANIDMVVKEPQKPTAAKREYLPSKFQCCERIMNAPRMNAPRIFSIKTLTGKVLNSNGDEEILYLRNAPRKEPIPRKRNSIPFMTMWEISSLFTLNLTEYSYTEYISKMI